MDMIAVALVVWFGGSLVAIIGLRLWTGSTQEQGGVIREIRETSARSQENCRMTNSTVARVAALQHGGRISHTFKRDDDLNDIVPQVESLLRRVVCLSEAAANMRVSELRERVRSLTQVEAETILLFRRARLLERKHTSRHLTGRLKVDDRVDFVSETRRPVRGPSPIFCRE